MACADDRSFPKQFFVWSGKVKGTDFIQLHSQEGSSVSGKKILPKWNIVLKEQDKRKKCRNTDSLTEHLLAIKEARIPILIHKTTEFYNDDLNMRRLLHFSTFTNGFTFGLLQAGLFGDNITVKNGHLDIYICKNDETQMKYQSYTNTGKVLENERIIAEDFSSPQSVWCGSNFRIDAHSIYFFYASEFSCFTPTNNGPLTTPSVPYLRVINHVTASTIPASKKRSKEFDQFCLQPDTFISELKKATKINLDPIENKNKALEALEKELKNVRNKYERESTQLEAVQDEMGQYKRENMRLQVVEKMLEDLKNENTRLKLKTTELEKVVYDYRNKIEVLEGKEEELENTKSENIRLQAVEKVLEDIKNENTRLALENAELGKANYDYCNKIEQLEGKAKEPENIEIESIRLQAREKALEDVKNENARLTVKTMELENVIYDYCNKIELLEGKERELENIKSENIRLKVSEKILESVKDEIKNQKAEIEEIKNGRENYRNKYKLLKEEYKELQSIRLENTRMKLFFEQVCQLSKDVTRN